MASRLNPCLEAESSTLLTLGRMLPSGGGLTGNVISNWQREDHRHSLKTFFPSTSKMAATNREHTVIKYAAQNPTSFSIYVLANQDSEPMLPTLVRD